MRRAAAEPDEAAAAPRGVPPRANPDLFGHSGAERMLRQLAERGRLPHALLLCGPRGIGKATLAFRLARFLLEGAGPSLAGVAEEGLVTDPASGVFRRVAAGGHADLLTVERAWDAKRRRLRGDILLDDVREIAGCLHLTAAEEGWRIVIVDGAEDMNRNAANALLKILEEPPRHTLLVLVSHVPGRLLPTIRSRCRRLVLAPLPQPLVRDLVLRYRPEIEPADAESLAVLASGSLGRAVELADAGGLALYRGLIEILSELPRIDTPRLHAFADRLSRADAEEAYGAASELLVQLLARIAAVGAAEGGGEVFEAERRLIAQLASAAPPARWAALSGEIGRSLGRAEALNLDRKQAFLGAAFALAEAAA